MNTKYYSFFYSGGFLALSKQMIEKMTNSRPKINAPIAAIKKLMKTIGNLNRWAFFKRGGFFRITLNSETVCDIRNL